MKRLIMLSTLTVAVVAFAGPAEAAKPTVTHTEVRKGVVESFREVDPCLGPSTINLVFNDVFHITAFVAGPNAGNVHVTFTQTGKFVIDPDDPSLGDFTGRFTVWGGFNANRRNISATFTFNATGRSAEGLRVRFHVVDHINLTATGVEHSFTFETNDCPV
jgi:hypothetical protein